MKPRTTWDDSKSDPVADIKAAKEAIEKQCGYLPQAIPKVIIETIKKMIEKAREIGMQLNGKAQDFESYKHTKGE